MADFTDDASSIAAVRRSSALLPPFVSPRGTAGVARRTPHPVAPLHGGHSAPARLYTPSGAPTVRRAVETLASASDLTNGAAPELTNGDAPKLTPGDAPELAARSEVEPSAPEAAPEAEPVSAILPTEYDAAFVDESAAEETQTAAAAEAESIDTESVDTESVDDDWFATEAGEADATSEPMHPTPAFSDLRGLERLATDAAPNEPPSGISTDAGLNEVSAAADPLATLAYDATAADRDVENGAQSASLTSIPAAATPAHEAVASVVDVLERTAHRIRDGQLALPSDLATASDAAALAAVLTALLRTPRE